MFLSHTAWAAALIVLNGLGARSATVQLGQTTVTGRDIHTLGQEFFGAIPYAEPPVGQLRLKPPVSKLSLSDATFNATQFGPGCIQPAAATNPSGYSEDCLTVNVLRPAGVTGATQLPVLVWVYGGGFLDGVSGNFNGSAIVAQSVSRGTPIIYVSLNYRLGPLGFPQGQEADDKGVLNLGLKDQLAALQWVQANICSFGGDASKVTVFGESAGAISIAIHMLRPSFTQLARATILESGSAASTVTNYAKVRGGDWDAFIGAIPACASVVGTNTTVDCLRNANLDVATITSGITSAVSKSDEAYPYVPALDGEVYPALPSVVLSHGNYAKIPFITGTNLDEGTLFTGNPAAITGDPYTRNLLVHNFSPSLLPVAGSSLLNDSANALLKLYPDVPALGSPYNTGNETFGLNSNYKRVAAIIGDLSFQSQRRLLQQFTSAANIKSYGYLFTDPQPQYPPPYGVLHSAEIPYVYGNCAGRSAAVQALCLQMVNYWVSFTSSLDPNDGKGSARPAWPQYSNKTPTLLEFNSAKTEVIPDTYRKAQIDFINANSVVYHHRRSLMRRNVV